MTTTRRAFVRNSFALGATIGVGGLLAACGDDDDTSTSSGGTSTPEDDTTTTTAAELATLDVMMPFPLVLAFLADVAGTSGGFLEAEGVEQNLQFARSAPQAMQQLVAGNVDLIRNAPIAVVNAQKEGADVIAIGSPVQRNLYLVVSTPEAPVDSLDALVGKSVGMATLGGNAEQILDLVLKSAGVDPTQVSREAVGNEATSYVLMEEGRIDVLFATTEAVTSMRAEGLEPHVYDVNDVNPLLGNCLVTTRAVMEEKRDALVAYLRGLATSMRAIHDETDYEELMTSVADEWELPQLEDPESVRGVVAGISELWFSEGDENLLRNIPEAWESGIETFQRMKIAPEDATPEQYYTNELWDEAFA